MFKIAGSVKYPFGAISPSDPTSTALGFHTREAAESHADTMNACAERFPEGWNVDFWKTKPEPWVVFETPNV